VERPHLEYSQHITRETATKVGGSVGLTPRGDIDPKAVEQPCGCCVSGPRPFTMRRGHCYLIASLKPKTLLTAIVCQSSYP
jgi:hypothetical protein